MFASILLTTKTPILAPQITKDSNIFKNYIANIDWDAALSKVIATVISLIVVSFLFFIIHSLGKKLIKNAVKKGKLTKHWSQGRIDTVYTLSQNIFHYTVLFFYFYAILSILGVPVGTLLAGAGIMSVALGLGAQGFVTDMVTGFFILLEQQFSVGDSVKIGMIEGTVHAVGLRTTQVLGYDGTLHFIPNRNITIVSNLSRNDMRALIDVRIDPNKDLTAMKDIMVAVNEKLVPKYRDNITKEPVIIGTVDTGNGALAMRVVIYTKNGAQVKIQAAFLAAYLQELTNAGFDIPNPALNLTAK